MSIAANVLLVFLIPVTLLANATLRDAQRLSGPDIMGPAFYFVVTCVVRWVGAVIVISLVVAGGSFDAAIPNRGAQLLLTVGTFALVEWAAGIADVACAPQTVSAGPALIMIGRVFSFVLPIAMILWLMPMVHANLSRGAMWATLAGIVVLSISTLPVFYGVYSKTNRKKQLSIQTYWESQQRLIAQGTAEIAALPADCLLEKLTAYFAEKWPPDVRSEVFMRLQKRTGIPDELMTMLGDDARRAAAFEYLQQISNEPGPGFNTRLRDFSLELAQKWKACESNLSEQQSLLLAADCEGFIHIAYGRHTDSLDFYPAMNGWREALKNAPQTPAILEALKNLNHWFELYPRTT